MSPAPAPRVAMSGISLSAALFICGASVGWLSGLSISPTIGTIIGASFGVMTAIVGGLSAVRGRPGAGLRVAGGAGAWPIALLAAGTAIGAPIGIWARTHHWFGQSDQQLVDALVALNVPEDKAKYRVAELRYSQSAIKDPGSLDLLFGTGMSESLCTKLSGLPPQKQRLELLSVLAQKSAATACGEDDLCITKLVDTVCSAPSQSAPSPSP